VYSFTVATINGCYMFRLRSSHYQAVRVYQKYERKSCICSAYRYKWLVARSRPYIWRYIRIGLLHIESHLQCKRYCINVDRLYIYINTHTHTHTHTHTYMHACIHTYIHTRTFIDTYVHTRRYIHTYSYIHTYIHTRTYIHTYSYIYIHTNTHTHTYLLTPIILGNSNVLNNTLLEQKQRWFLEHLVYIFEQLFCRLC
jgi:hypothetical protein